MKKIVFTAFFLFNFSLLFSQYNVSGNGTSAEKARDIQRKANLEDYSRNSMQKSKLNFFLNDEWQGGVMFTNDSSTINGYSYRYNIYTDQIELRSVVDPSRLDIVSIGTKKFIFSSYYNGDGSLEEGYFELIVNGDCKLLLKRGIKYTRPSSDIEAYGSIESTSIEEKLYIKKDKDAAVEVLKSKDFLIDLMSDKEQAVHFINKQLIVFYSEKRIREIVEFYNEI